LNGLITFSFYQGATGESGPGGGPGSTGAEVKLSARSPEFTCILATEDMSRLSDKLHQSRVLGSL